MNCPIRQSSGTALPVIGLQFLLPMAPQTPAIFRFAIEFLGGVFQIDAVLLQEAIQGKRRIEAEQLLNFGPGKDLAR